MLLGHCVKIYYKSIIHSSLSGLVLKSIAVHRPWRPSCCGTCRSNDDPPWLPWTLPRRTARQCTHDGGGGFCRSRQPGNMEIWSWNYVLSRKLKKSNEYIIQIPKWTNQLLLFVKKVPKTIKCKGHCENPLTSPLNTFQCVLSYIT